MLPPSEDVSIGCSFLSFPLFGILELEAPLPLPPKEGSPLILARGGATVLFVKLRVQHKLGIPGNWENWEFACPFLAAQATIPHVPEFDGSLSLGHGLGLALEPEEAISCSSRKLLQHADQFKTNLAPLLIHNCDHKSTASDWKLTMFLGAKNAPS